jgi:translation initiation factor IF-2
MPVDTEVKKVDVPSVVTLKDFAETLSVPAADIQRKLMSLGVLAALNQKLSPEVTTRLGKSFGYVVNIVQTPTASAAPAAAAVASAVKPAAVPPKVRIKGAGGPVSRPPVVTIMGHVDHGKTTLLDAIRNARVVDSEFGGITQHIGAYQVDVPDPEQEGGTRKITFLDTPGHEAFTAMRARGAQVTDIAVIVVAANDGVMPQTIEAINHAKASGVPIVIALNKIDVDGADPTRVLTQLTEHDVMPEKFGGTVQTVEVSAKEKLGLDDLLATILLVADAEVEPKADPNAPATAAVVEAELDKGRGPVATVLIEQGTLRAGDAVVAGTSYGRVRAMINDRGQRVERATPATPVEILGLNSVPVAGDRLEVAKNEKDARQRAEARQATERESRLGSSTRITLEDIVRQYKEGTVKELNLIVKADVQGSVEAIRESLTKIEHPEVKVVFILTGVGPVSESDILLASASNAICLGFNVKADNSARKLAEKEHVEIREYQIIYDLIDDVRLAMGGLLEPNYEEEHMGTVEVRAVFKLPRLGGSIAGSYVQEGKVSRTSSVRARRNKQLIYEGKIDTLRREKDDVREVAAGYECGILVPGYLPEIGDILEVYEIRKVQRTI